MRNFLLLVHGFLFKDTYNYAELLLLYWLYITYPNLGWWIVACFIGIIFVVFIVRDITKGIIDRFFMW